MAKDLIKFSNDRKGFRILLLIELALAIWSVAATYTSLRAGSRRSVVYGIVCMLGIFYILGRSFRSYRDLVKKEKEEKEQEKADV